MVNFNLHFSCSQLASLHASRAGATDRKNDSETTGRIPLTYQSAYKFCHLKQSEKWRLALTFHHPPASLHIRKRWRNLQD